VAREAFLYGQTPRQHFIRMLCHGILHLAGFDHGPQMFDLTDQAVAAVARS
jgi:probable rRNA maturation factor